MMTTPFRRIMRTCCEKPLERPAYRDPTRVTCRFPGVKNTHGLKGETFFRVFVGNTEETSSAYVFYGRKDSPRLEFDSREAEKYSKQLLLVFLGKETAVGYTEKTGKVPHLCIQELLRKEEDEAVVYLGQWSVPFGTIEIHQHHFLVNPHTRILVPDGINISDVLGYKIKWEGAPKRSENSALLTTIYKEEHESQQLCLQDNQLLADHAVFLDGHQGDRDAQMCRQELVGNAGGFCRIQSLLLDLSSNFKADERWFTELFRGSFFQMGIKWDEEDVKKVAKAIVRGITNHATSFQYRGDKIPLENGEEIAVDMWQRRLLEGCGDCEDFGLLMLAMRNRLLEEEWQTAFLVRIQAVLGALDMFACCVRAAAPQLDPSAGAVRADVKGNDIQTVPETVKRATAIQNSMQTFHVACFLAGDGKSPVKGLDVDSREVWRRRHSKELREYLREQLFIAEGTFSYGEEALKNNYTAAEVGEFVEAIKVTASNPSLGKVTHFPTGASVKGGAELGAIYGPVMMCMLPFEVKHTQSAEWANLLLPSAVVENKRLSGIVPVGAMKEGLFMALSPITRTDRRLSELQLQLEAPVPTLTAKGIRTAPVSMTCLVWLRGPFTVECVVIHPCPEEETARPYKKQDETPP